jgi:RNA polymerase sigma-70 factor (ECF subfamily)
MEEAAFASLYEATYQPLWAYVVKGVREGAVADDITQEAYVRLLQVDTAGLEARQVKAYLYRIATNLMHDHWRQGRREAPDDAVERERTEGTRDPRLDLSLDVHEAFERLPPNQRVLLWLAYVEGFGHRDIARMTNVGEKSVRVLLFRARSRFADLLRSMGIDRSDAP